MKTTLTSLFSPRVNGTKHRSRVQSSNLRKTVVVPRGVRTSPMKSLPKRVVRNNNMQTTNENSSTVSNQKNDGQRNRSATAPVAPRRVTPKPVVTRSDVPRVAPRPVGLVAKPILPPLPLPAPQSVAPQSNNQSNNQSNDQSKKRKDITNTPPLHKSSSLKGFSSPNRRRSKKRRSLMFSSSPSKSKEKRLSSPAGKYATISSRHRPRFQPSQLLHVACRAATHPSSFNSFDRLEELREVFSLMVSSEYTCTDEDFDALMLLHETGPFELRNEILNVMSSCYGLAETIGRLAKTIQNPSSTTSELLLTDQTQNITTTSKSQKSQSSTKIQFTPAQQIVRRQSASVLSSFVLYTQCLKNDPSIIDANISQCECGLIAHLPELLSGLNDPETAVQSNVLAALTTGRVDVIGSLMSMACRLQGIQRNKRCSTNTLLDQSLLDESCLLLDELIDILQRALLPPGHTMDQDESTSSLTNSGGTSSASNLFSESIESKERALEAILTSLFYLDSMISSNWDQEKISLRLNSIIALLLSKLMSTTKQGGHVIFAKMPRLRWMSARVLYRFALRTPAFDRKALDQLKDIIRKEKHEEVKQKAMDTLDLLEDEAPVQPTTPRGGSTTPRASSCLDQEQEEHNSLQDQVIDAIQVLGSNKCSASQIAKYLTSERPQLGATKRSIKLVLKVLQRKGLIQKQSAQFQLN